jgi:hypothetical protein
MMMTMRTINVLVSTLQNNAFVIMSVSGMDCERRYNDNKSGGYQNKTFDHTLAPINKRYSKYIYMMGQDKYVM